ncbi:hypothetical protein KNP414_06391 [Paenibacillus mucilaginosus KNP414]|uniref:Uncharacterized protein n=1 Tax=Paenibacillus mucilaginosus (strain KNP414) TaxID=1036673 RepID=F8FMV2_PAEMK|nr:hypothetical protein KNP414_06391 [Paenibacillus mucilaginosus KNP414]
MEQPPSSIINPIARITTAADSPSPPSLPIDPRTPVCSILSPTLLAACKKTHPVVRGQQGVFPFQCSRPR